MKHFHLDRDTFDPNGVWGQLEGPGLELGTVLVLQTIENPDTLIPPGEYICERDMYWGGDGVGGAGDYPTFEIPVPGRMEIKFHAANYASQLEGCIAPGMERGYTDDHLPAVWRSRHAHGLYMASLVGEDRHILTITESGRE